MTLRRWSAAAVATLVATMATVASAVAQDPPKMTWGVFPGYEFQTGTFNSAERNYPCTVQVMGWARENGVSGVQRIRIHYELYGAYAPLHLPSERSSNQVAYPRQSGGEFPDDFNSYYLTALMPWGLWFEENGERLIMDYVGERPSFWKPDIHEEVELGAFDCGYGEEPRACSTALDAPLRCPGDTRPLEEQGTEVTGEGRAPGRSDQDQDGVDDSLDCPAGTIETPGSRGTCISPPRS